MKICKVVIFFMLPMFVACQSTNYQKLSRGIKNLDYIKVTKALENGADINKPFASNTPPIMHAVSTNDNKLIEIFLKYGADSNTKHDGISALSLAAYLNNTAVVSELIQYGADVNLKDDVGNIPPIYHAIKNENYEMARIFVKSGARLNDIFGNNETLLVTAVDQKSTKGVNFILESGGNVDAIIDYGLNFTGLSLSILNKNEEMASIFLKFNADIEQDIANNYKPIHLAVMYQNLPIVKMLLDKGARCSSRTKKLGLSPAQMAHGSSDTIYNYLTTHCKHNK